MHSNQDIILPDCPVCGKSRGATTKSTTWGHWVSCCSEECGQEMGRRLKELRNSEEMIQCRQELQDVQNRIMNMVLEVAPNSDDFELEKWMK